MSQSRRQTWTRKRSRTTAETDVRFWQPPVGRAEAGIRAASVVALDNGKTIESNPPKPASNKKMKPTDKFLGLRTYTVIPGTVQTPIKITMDGASRRKIAGRFENTRDIVQPAGRQAQQGAHVRGMLEHHLILSD